MLFHNTHLQTGYVPLVAAAEKGHTQTVERLLEARANVNHQNKVMASYLHYVQTQDTKAIACVKAHSTTYRIHVCESHKP